MKRLIILLAIWMALPVGAASAAGAPSVAARSAIVMDADTGTVLYEKDADRRSLIASTTKIMTGLLVCQSCDLDARVQVPKQAVGIEGTSLYLREDEVLTGRELLYGLLLQSANDAATALAILSAGSEAAFVAEMNARAADLGLTNTHYANPHGLDAEEHYSTARDLAVLTAEALKNETFRQVVAKKGATISGDRTLSNHNKLLWSYPGCIGVKTGYTKAAGRILVSAAQREGRTLICVTIRDPDDWADHTALLDYGFSCYRRQVVAVAGEPVALRGGVERLPLIARAGLTLPLLPEEEVTLTFTPGLHSSLLRGREAGTLDVWVGEQLVARVPVCWP